MMKMAVRYDTKIIVQLILLNVLLRIARLSFTNYETIPKQGEMVHQKVRIKSRENCGETTSRANTRLSRSPALEQGKRVQMCQEHQKVLDNSCVNRGETA